ncbi:MAG: macro domain-containing protein [Longimicrobiales bacterium]
MIRVALCGPAAAGTESILRSISSELEPDTPESRDLEVEAGSVVADRLRAMGTLPVGAAVITPGGGLPTAFLIHVVLQSAEEPVRTESLRLALQNGLRRAREWGLESLALAPLGTGAGNLGAEEAAEAMVPLIQDHLRRFEHPREVVITVSNDYENDVFLRAVELAGGQASAQES